MTPPELIATENIPMIWPIIAPRLQRTMEKLEFVEFSLNDVLGLLNLGQAQLWVANDGEMIMITRIGNYPEVKRLIIDFIEGENHKDYFEHMEYIEAWAVGLGATQAEAEVRPGLAKVLKKSGWQRKRITIYKHLTKGLH